MSILAVGSAIFELRRALRAYFTSLGSAVTIESSASRPWSSITFHGERHRIALSVPSQAAADAFLDGLDDREFILRGHVLADIEATCVKRNPDGDVSVILEALTVDDQ